MERNVFIFLSLLHFFIKKKPTVHTIPKKRPEIWLHKHSRLSVHQMREGKNRLIACGGSSKLMHWWRTCQETEVILYICSKRKQNPTENSKDLEQIGQPNDQPKCGKAYFSVVFEMKMKGKMGSHWSLPSPLGWTVLPQQVLLGRQIT